MSWVEDARKLMQDFVAPEVRGINIRIDALAESMKSAFAAFDRRFDEFDRRFDDDGKRDVERHRALLEKLELYRRELSLQIDLAIAQRKIEKLQGRHHETLARPETN